MNYCTPLPPEQLVINVPVASKLDLNYLPATELALRIVTYVVAMILALVGNTLIIVIFAKSKKMRTVTNYYLVNLAVSDLLIVFFCMWAHLGSNLTQTDYWPFGSIMCSVNLWLRVTVYTAGIFTLVFIAIDRFIAIVLPFWRRPTNTNLGAGICIAFTWVAGALLALPQLLYTKLQEIYFTNLVSRVCKEMWPKTKLVSDGCQVRSHMVGYKLSSNCVGYLLPVLIMSIAYICISVKLLLQPGHGQDAQKSGKVKVVRLLVAVLAGFVICWSPFKINQMITVVTASGDNPILVYWFIYLAYFSSVLNPLLYAGFNENFRKELLEIIPCLNTNNRISTAEINSAQTFAD